MLKANQEGQAALERARGKSAAVRNLANASRLIEGQPVLTTIYFLQTLEADLSALLPALNARCQATCICAGRNHVREETQSPGG